MAKPRKAASGIEQLRAFLESKTPDEREELAEQVARAARVEALQAIRGRGANNPVVVGVVGRNISTDGAILWSRGGDAESETDVLAEFAASILMWGACFSDTPPGAEIRTLEKESRTWKAEVRRREPRHGPQRPAKLVARAKELRAMKESNGRPWSHQKVANHLNAEKFRTERNEKWNRRSVGQMLRSHGIS